MPVRTLTVSNAKLENDLVEINDDSEQIKMRDKDVRDTKSGHDDTSADRKRGIVSTGIGGQSEKIEMGELKKNKSFEKRILENSDASDTKLTGNNVNSRNMQKNKPDLNNGSEANARKGDSNRNNLNGMKTRDTELHDFGRGKERDMESGRINGKEDGKQDRSERINGKEDGKQDRSERINEKEDGKQDRSERMNGKEDSKQDRSERINGKEDGKQDRSERMNGKEDGKQDRLERMNGKEDGKQDRSERIKKTRDNSKQTNNTKNGADVNKTNSKSLPRKVVGCRRCIHILLFLFLFGNDIADFVSDWLFFTDVVIAESGLVYGPPEPVAVWFLLVFSIIGTCTFIFECINLWWEFFRGNSWLDSDWLSAVVIWIEDVPQVIISLSLILCREEPISVFQLVKAIVILISVVIRIVVTSVKYCNKKAIKSRHHVKIKAVIMLGIIIEAFAAGAIFVLTQTERNNAGDISYRVPSTVIEDGYDDQRYFRDVSIFFHDRNLANQNPQTNSMVDWIRLATIYSIREGDQETSSFRVEYEQAGGSLNKLAISGKERDYDNWTLSECYSIDPNTKNITQVSNTICSQPGFFSNSTSLFMKLTFEKPGSIFKRKIFGDVHMNVKKLQNGVCTSVNDYADSIESSISNNIPLTFHYYRTNETLHPGNVKHLLQSGIPSFYTSSDIIDVSVVWKTGWKDCESSGHVAPILDKDLTLTCL